MPRGDRKRGVGCLLALAIYIPAIVVGYFITLPAEVTGTFEGKDARIFSVAAVRQDEEGPSYERTTLETIRGFSADRPLPGFLLPEPQVVISAGDIHHVYVVEDHGDWQLIEFNYANSYTSTSVYRAYAGRVEPVSFQIKSHAGQAMLAVALIVPVYFVAWLITFIRRRRAENRG